MRTINLSLKKRQYRPIFDISWLTKGSIPGYMPKTSVRWIAEEGSHPGMKATHTEGLHSENKPWQFFAFIVTQ